MSEEERDVGREGERGRGEKGRETGRKREGGREERREREKLDTE